MEILLTIIGTIAAIIFYIFISFAVAAILATPFYFLLPLVFNQQFSFLSVTVSVWLVWFTLSLAKRFLNGQTN